MKSIEKGFGARMGRSQTMVNYLSGFSNYQTVRDEDNLSNLNQLVTELMLANSEVATNVSNYKSAVNNRWMLFKSKETGLDKIISDISLLLKAQFGTSSQEYVKIHAIVKKMRGYTKKKELTETIMSEENVPTATSISSSHQSYNSATQYFSDIISTLLLMPSYQSPTQEHSLESLQIRLEELRLTNSTVTNTGLVLINSQVQRELKFKDLHTRYLRIKANVRFLYGLNSKEFGLIKQLEL